MTALTRMGDATSWALMVMVLFCLGGAGRHAAERLAVATGLATALSQVLKRSCRRPRPSVSDAVGLQLATDPDAFSFPSGHTAAAFAAALVFAGWTPLGMFFLVLALLIGASRVYMGAHYPLDVAAGALLGSLAGALAKILV